MTLLFMVGQGFGADERLGRRDEAETALELPVLARVSLDILERSHKEASCAPTRSTGSMIGF